MWIFQVIRSSINALNASFRLWSNVDRYRSLADVPIEVLRDLQLVYMLLSFSFTSLAFGFFFSQNGIIENWFSMSGLIISLALLHLVAPKFQGIRALLVIITAFFVGAVVGPHIVDFLGTNPGSLATSLVGISLGFRIYWAVTIWGRSIDYWFYSGAYLSAPVIFLWTLASSIEFGGLPPQWTPETFVATMSVLMYVAGYTAVVVREIEHGDEDHVKHAIYLITGLLDVTFQCARMMLGVAILVLSIIFSVGYWLHVHSYLLNFSRRGNHVSVD